MVGGTAVAGDVLMLVLLSSSDVDVMVLDFKTKIGVKKKHEKKN